MEIEIKLDRPKDNPRKEAQRNANNEQLIIDSRPLKHITLTDRIRLNQEPDQKPHETCGSDGEIYEITYDDNIESMDRGAWAKKIDFILTCVSFAVGLGNVWRFPYLVYKNGGGAFLIPYLLMLILVGLPIFFLEFAFGQFSSLGPISCWIISPLFKGVGYGMVIMTWYLTLYYNVIISHCLFYLVMSFRSKLPWTTCNNYWNDNSTCFDNSNQTLSLLANQSSKVSSSEQFYERYVLEVSEGIDDFGLPSWKLVLCLLVAWSVVLAVLIRGVQSLGKISYFTASFPYVMLTILLLRSVFLPGSLTGIRYYVTPVFGRLKDPRVWTDAATQIFFSLSCCNGGLINMASYNKFKNNCCRDAIIVAIINCATSVFAGFVIFANLGFMAEIKNVTMDQVAKGGPGLAFVVYPEALANMPIAPLWSVLFFIMMVTLGFGSQFALVETVISGFQDDLMRMKIITTKKRRLMFRCFVCATGFLLGIPMVCRGGIYLLTLLDWTVSGYPLLVLGLLEILVICYFYGIKQFTSDISMMTKQKPNWYWKANWLAFTPLVLSALIIFYFAMGNDLQYGKYLFPRPWIVLSHIVALFPLLIIPVWFSYRYCRDGGFILLREYMKPQSDWGPAKEEDRAKFMDMIRSTESFRKKDQLCPCDEGDMEAADDTKFFQSKQSIIDKLIKTVTKETIDSSAANVAASEYCMLSPHMDTNKLIKSTPDVASNNLAE